MKTGVVFLTAHNTRESASDATWQQIIAVNVAKITDVRESEFADFPGAILSLGEECSGVIVQEYHWRVRELMDNPVTLAIPELKDFLYIEARSERLRHYGIKTDRAFLGIDGCKRCGAYRFHLMRQRLDWSAA